jgi:hypothetical protein
MSKDAPITQDNRWYKGEAKLLEFDIVDKNDAPLDVSGYAMAWTLEDLEPGGAATDIIAKATGGLGITVENGQGTGDRVVITIDRADTIDLDPAIYMHSLERTDVASEALLLDGSAMLQAAAAAD